MRPMQPPKSTGRENNLVFWMVALGLLAIWAGGSDIVSRWPALVFGARLCDVLILISGTVLLAAGIWHIAAREMRRPSLVLAAVGATGFSATLFIGLLTGAIPCSGAG